MSWAPETPEQHYLEILEEVDYTRPTGQCMDLSMPKLSFGSQRAQTKAWHREVRVARRRCIDRQTNATIASEEGVCPQRISGILQKFLWRIDLMCARESARLLIPLTRTDALVVLIIAANQ